MYIDIQNAKNTKNPAEKWTPYDRESFTMGI